MFTILFAALFYLFDVFEEDFWAAVVWLGITVLADYYLVQHWIG